MAATLALVTSQLTNSILKYNLNNGSYAGVFAGDLLTNPRGLVTGSDGKVYVSNNDQTTPAVLRYNSDGTGQTSFASDATLTTPRGICFDATGKLYVANENGNNVLRFNADGSFDRVFASGNGLTSPVSCKIGNDGKLYVTSIGLTRGILRFNADGTFDQTFIDVGASPQDLIQDSNGNWYVSDFTTKSVVKYNGSGSRQGSLQQREAVIH
jgi:DNA-binding beta-propeller fold protein YncE